MEYFYYVKLWLKEWWSSFQQPVEQVENMPLTLEQKLFEDLRSLHEVIRPLELTEPLMMFQLIDRRELTSLHTTDLLRRITLLTAIVSDQLPAKNDSSIVRTIRLDDWFVDEKDVPVYVSEFYKGLIVAVDRLITEYDAKKDLSTWAHYVRKASPYIADVIVLYQWYLEINE